MIAAAPKQNDPAEAATSNRARNHQNSAREPMAAMRDSTSAIGREEQDRRVAVAVRDLENEVNVIASMTSIAQHLAEDALQISKFVPQPNGFVQLLLTQTQWNDLAFIIGEAMDRTASFRNLYYAAIEGKHS